MDREDIGKVLQWKNACRLCLLEDGIKLPIFEEEGRQRQVSFKIETCFSFVIYEADPLPEMICHKCLFKLEEAYDFQQKCMEVNATMLRHLQPFSQQRSVQQYLALAGRHHRENSLNHSDDMSILEADHIETKLQPDSSPPRPARSPTNTGNTFQEVFLEEFSTDSFFSEVVLEDSLQETMEIAQNSPQLPPAPPTPPPPPPPASLPETSLLQPTCLQSPAQPNLWSSSQIKKEPGLGSVVQHKTPSGVHITLQQTAPVAATIVRANPPAQSNPPSARFNPSLAQSIPPSASSNPSLAQSNPPSTHSNPSAAHYNPPTRSNPSPTRSNHPSRSNPSPARSNPSPARSNPPSTRSNPPPASSNPVTPPIASPQPPTLKKVPLDIKPRKCKTCHFASTSREEMDKHLCSFQMSWQCNVCMKYFYTKGALLKHKGVCRSKSYKCTQCKLSFASLEKMAQHRIIHTKVLAYVREEDMSVCSCGKKFGCKMMMRIHKRYHLAYPRTESPTGASIRNGTDRFSGKSGW